MDPEPLLRVSASRAEDHSTGHLQGYGSSAWGWEPEERQQRHLHQIRNPAPLALIATVLGKLHFGHRTAGLIPFLISFPFRETIFCEETE